MKVLIKVVKQQAKHSLNTKNTHETQVFPICGLQKACQKLSFQVDLELEVFALYLPNGFKNVRKIEIKIQGSEKDIFQNQNGSFG